MKTEPTVVSAPGKVLLAGGYLVLDPLYTGIVVSTSSRFYTIIHGAGDNCENTIKVHSPQFEDAIWNYAVTVSDKGKVEVVPSESDTSTNKFVHLALDRTLLLAVEAATVETVKATLEKGLSITIMGDNDFYSQRAQLSARNLPPTLQSLASLPKFSPTGVKLSEVHKTGLGSSAALITSLVSALLIHFSAIPSTSLDEGVQQDFSEGRQLAHNAAQYIHCLAQGKVGSGFDVASATFGSQLYGRFDPKVIEPLMVDHTPTEPLLPVLSPSNKAWNQRVKPFQLPPLTRLMLADVDAGSDTPSLVGKVLKWRKENADQALTLWTDLGKSNDAFAATLKELGELHAQLPKEYGLAVQSLRSLPHDKWTTLAVAPKEMQVIECFILLQQLTEDIRTKMREMGDLSGVSIEPKEQTALLNKCISEAGVIGGGVPGAGGYDAIWLLVFDDAEGEDCSSGPAESVQKVWMGWKDMSVSPLSATESLERGAKLEHPEDFTGCDPLGYIFSLMGAAEPICG